MKSVYALTIVICLLVLYSCSGSKYELGTGDFEHVGITEIATGELIVSPAIVEVELQNGHYYGYRLPKEDLICTRVRTGTKYTLPILNLNPIFFSLDLNTGVHEEFTDRSIFRKHLQSVGIEMGNKFTNIEASPLVKHYRATYEDFDFSNCSSVG